MVAVESWVDVGHRLTGVGDARFSRVGFLEEDTASVGAARVVGGEGCTAEVVLHRLEPFDEDGPARIGASRSGVVGEEHGLTIGFGYGILT